MHCLIDADSIVFRCGFAVEHKQHKFYIKGEEHLGPFQIYEYKKDIPKEFKDDPEIFCEETVVVEPLENALHLVKQELDGIISATAATSYSVYIKGKGNFREEISVTRKYKGNRDVTHRPKYEHEIRQYLKEYWKAEEVDGMEVDDKCAVEQTRLNQFDKFMGLNGVEYVFKYETPESIIASIDKDMDQVPGWHYNFMKKEKYWVDEAQAIRSFYIQLLTGDPSDNIQGVKGTGIARAEELYEGVSREQDFFRIAKVEYDRVYGDKGLEILTEMANLVYLRRAEGEAWQPPV